MKNAQVFNRSVVAVLAKCPSHDRIIMSCQIETFFAVTFTFEVIFYHFDYEADSMKPNHERCIHTAHDVFSGEPIEPTNSNLDIWKWT